GRIIEIDQVDRRDARCVQRHVVVINVPGVVGKILPDIERARRIQDSSRQLRGRVGRKRNGEIFVADHVPQDAELQLLVAFGFTQGPGEKTAAVESVRFAELLHCFLAVEENQLDFSRQLRIESERARQLDKRTGARSAIARADETDGVENLRIEM